MKKKVWVLSPVFYAVVAVMCLMTGFSWFLSKTAFFIEAALCILSAAAVTIQLVFFKSYIKTSVKTAERVLSGYDHSALESFSAPVVVVGEAGDILWANSRFITCISGGRESRGETVAPYIQSKTLSLLLNHDGVDVAAGNRLYTLYAAACDRGYILTYIDDTVYKNTAAEYAESRPVVAMILFDNREELSGDATVSDEAQISVAVESVLGGWATSMSGILKRLSNGRYMLITEERHIRAAADKKFEVLEQIRAVKTTDGKCATVSIGVGRGAGSFKESEDWARKALDMALGRGGDQAAVRQGDDYQFFGGVSRGVERHNLVRTRVIASTLSDQIKLSDTVLIMGHRYSDLDSVGASIGLWSAVTKGQGKTAAVVVNKAQSLAQPLMKIFEDAGNDAMFITPQQALAMVTPKTLLVIVDTHSPDFLESRELYQAARRIVVIDHHRMMVSHISNAQIFYHESYASSASEMVAELVQYLGENTLTKTEAEALLAGIALDTKNFVLKTGVRTFEAAAFLRRRGADTVEVKRLFSNTIDTYKVKYQLVSGAEIFNNCAIACADECSADIRLASAQAADELLEIQGVAASFVLYACNGVVNISARSLGEVNVQLIMEAMGGGGHHTMAGTQLQGVSVEQARDKLISILSEQSVQTH